MRQEPVARGASAAKTRMSDIGQAWWRHHRVSATSSFFRLIGAPAQTLMTSLVVAIALALPAALYVLLDNVYALGDRWDSGPKVSVYLMRDSDLQAITELKQTIATMPQVAAVDHISAEQALQQFQAHSGFGEAITVLDENPLPHTLVVTPVATSLDPESLQRLTDALGEYPLVEQVELDLAWVKKLKAMMALGQRAVFGLAILLWLGVLLAIGNTVRLEIENRRDEIVVTKLVGGTNGFVRRPLLYTGAWYGFLGGWLACLLVSVAFFGLQGPVGELAFTYQSEFKLLGLGLVGSVWIIVAGTALGLFGAWLATARHLRAIEPR